MNWDAVGVLSNIILVAALVAITAWYAGKVSKQTAVMVQEGEKNKILEEVQEVLTPNIDHLKEEIKAIKEHKIWWHRYTSGRCDFEAYPSKLLYADIKEYGGAARDVFSKFPDLTGRFSSHDDLYDKLNDLYAKIENEVKTPALEERLKILVNQFNESRDAARRLSRDFFEKPGLMWGEFIINHKYTIERSSNSIQPNIDFWEEHRAELLKFREKPQIKELDKEIEGLLRQLKVLDETLLEKLERIREKYRVKYNFTESQIDPELKEIETVM
jgi:hypothetical protein